MRITGGDFKGRTISFPAVSKERPTSDFLREALFNLLGSLEGKKFLDLFAGSGSVGMEAASRGADEVVLVEKNRKLKVIAEENIRLLSLENKCRVICSQVDKALKELAHKSYRADVIFVDPPYNKNLADETLETLSAQSILAEGGTIVVQHSAKETLGHNYNKKIFQVRQKIYGENALTFFTGERK